MPNWHPNDRRHLYDAAGYPIEGPELGDPERLTDLGNARRLVYLHGVDLRYAGGRWYFWEGTRWAIDETGEVERRAKDTVRWMYEAAQDKSDDAERVRLAKFALASESENKLRAMIALARSEPPIPMPLDHFDSNPFLLNCQSGTVDLRTGVVGPYLREDFITKVAGARHDPGSKCPAWDGFLRRIFAGNESLIAFVQRAVGYTLLGQANEQVLFFCHGTGANGKSTLLETLRSIFGGHSRAADFTTFSKRGNDGPRNDIIRLRGARLVTAIEFSLGRSLDETVIKQLTGGDTVTARRLYAEAEEFRPNFTVWIATNHKPVVKGTEEAIWRRLMLIPFNVFIPQPERDGTLRERLLEEASGILGWAIEGALHYQRDGLMPPREVLLATANYRAEMDTVAPFLEARTRRDPTAEIRFGDLFQEYKSWAAETGEEPLSALVFGMRLSEKGFETRKKGGGIRFRIGLRLAQE